MQHPIVAWLCYSASYKSWLLYGYYCWALNKWLVNVDQWMSFFVIKRARLLTKVIGLALKAGSTDDMIIIWWSLFGVHCLIYNFNMTAIGTFLIHRPKALAVPSMHCVQYNRTATSIFSFTGLLKMFLPPKIFGTLSIN